jgi:hypothetical protein
MAQGDTTHALTLKGAQDNIAAPTTHHAEQPVKPIKTLAIALGLSLLSVASFAKAPAGAPAGSTGMCKDGTYTQNETKKGACSGHKGVKDWYGGEDAAAAAKAPATAAASAPMATAAPAAAPAKPMNTAAAKPAAGGGPGQVWVNTESKVYHCAGTKWYGKTKQGEYMTEAAAKAAGAHADHGKACSS